MNRYLLEKYFGLFFGIVGCIYFIYTGLTKEKIESEDDLMELQGRFLNYSFKDGTGYRKQGHEYYIWIDGYKNAFQIKADYLAIFRGIDFVTNVSPHDKIKFTIPKTQTNKLNSDKNVFVTSVNVKQKTYLSKHEVLKIEKGIATLYGDFFLAAGSLLVGLVVYIRNR